MGRAITKQVWVAEDGTQFDTQEEMVAYEHMKNTNHDTLVEEFFDTIYECPKRRQTEYRKVLAAWERFRLMKRLQQPSE